MDLLAQHEAFLRAIFDAPDDDTPRLVYADFLQENGEDVRAELIRVQCDLARLDDDCEPDRWAALEERNQWLSQSAIPWDEVPTGNGVTFNRGLWRESFAEGVAVTGEDLDDPLKFREWVVRVNPAWYGETNLYVRSDYRMLHPEAVRVLCGLPFIQQVTEWNLAGRFEELRPYAERSPAELYNEDFDFMPLAPGIYNRPVITTTGVNVLARNRTASRIRVLDLRDNRLDSDALAQSPYLDNLKQLLLLQGNDVSGRVWQKVIERFGEDVVE